MAKVMVLSSHTPSLRWFRLDLMKAFLSNGHTVVAVGNEPEENWSEFFRENGIVYRQAAIQRNGTNPLEDLATFRSLHTIIKEEKPQTIFAYQAKTVIYGGLAAKRNKVRTFSLIAGLGSIFINSGAKEKLLRSILSAEYKLALHYNEKVFFQNRDDSDFFVNNKITEPKKIVYLHGSGVNLDLFTPQEFPERFGFLFIGRLIKDKGILEYLEACKRVKKKYPQVRCLLVGAFDSNPSSLKEEELAGYLEEGVVEYFGEQADVRPFLAQCNVFVLPSYREGTPKTVLEAMASRRAVITCDVPGCKETVTDRKNGFLVPPKNIDLLAEKMIELYENQALTVQMAENGRKIAEDLFDVNKVNAVILNTMEL